MVVIIFYSKVCQETKDRFREYEGNTLESLLQLNKPSPSFEVTSLASFFFFFRPKPLSEQRSGSILRRITTLRPVQWFYDARRRSGHFIHSIKDGVTKTLTTIYFILPYIFHEWCQGWCIILIIVYKRGGVITFRLCHSINLHYLTLLVYF